MRWSSSTFSETIFVTLVPLRHLRRFLFNKVPSVGSADTKIKKLMNVRSQGGDTASHDLRTLVDVLLDPVELLHILRTSQELHKIFIVSDDQELKVTLL